MSIKTPLLMVLAATLAPGASVLCEELPPPALQHNPFLRPNLEALGAQSVQPAGAASGRNDGQREKTIAKNRAAFEEPLELRAILHAGRESLVNVGGVILGIGEEVDGYRLVKVEEREAVFRKDSLTFIVPMDER